MRSFINTVNKLIGTAAMIRSNGGVHHEEISKRSFTVQKSLLSSKELNLINNEIQSLCQDADKTKLYINNDYNNVIRLGDVHDKSPAVNKWLARSWINGGEEELFFLVESKKMIDDVASYYSLPVPYNNDLATVLTDDLQSTRIKSVDLNREGEGNWLAMVVASVVFQDNVATKIRFYKTSRWDK